jgi:hypothetical protein
VSDTPRIAAAALAVMLLALAGWGQMLFQPQEAAVVSSAWSGGAPEAAATVPRGTLEERIAAAFAIPEQPLAPPTGEVAAAAAAAAAGATRMREHADRRLAAVARRIDATARVTGEIRVSERLAAELGASAKALRAERARDAWSRIVIAHTLCSSARGEVAASRLLERRRQGEAWSAIIGGLRLDLDGAVRAVSDEARVVSGQARADGRVAAIHGAGSRFGDEPRLGPAVPAASAGLTVGAGAAGSGLGDLPRLRTGP